MKVQNIDPILREAEKTVRRHEISPGCYARFLREGRPGEMNPYGCADAANILYTLNRFPREPETRACWVEALRSLQDPETGMFREGTHVPMHTTAHCIAALELFDALPRYPLKELEPFLDRERLYALLDGLRWPWEDGCGHIGAGIYAALVITGMADGQWTEDYFRWFDRTCDPETGVWHRDHLTEDTNITHRMGGAFHYYFNYSHARRPMPYPEAIIDTCLDRCRRPDGTFTGYPEFGTRFHFIEMDWVYCLNRASRQTEHRFREGKAALETFAEDFLRWLEGVDWEHDEGANDLHMLFGTLCCLAELQQALPGKLLSSVPLRLVLDRRPFI